MISLDDCIAMCGLDEAEIAAIAEHEHIPEIAAAALGNYLLHRTSGEGEIHRMLVDDIRDALKDGRTAHAAELMGALRHFAGEHPDCLDQKLRPKDTIAVAGSCRESGKV